MPGYSINRFDRASEIPSFPDGGALGFVGEGLLMRTPLGVLYGLNGQISGKSIFLDPKNGDDGNDGFSAQSAVKTLAAAYALTTAGEGDVVYLLSSGETDASARLSAGFTWAKDNTHLVGLASGVNISNRARVAPTTGATGFANFFTVTGNGCLFQNIQFFQGFTVGIAAEICVTVTGGRNRFVNCHFAGMGDTDGGGGGSTDSRDVKISGTGENQFVACTFGLDTIARTVANASIELAGGTPRNVFQGCRMILWATNSGVLGILGAAGACIDRFTSFEECLFINSIKSGAGTAIKLLKLAAAAGGLVLFDKPGLVGFTCIANDSTTQGQSYVIGPVKDTAGSAGLGVQPTDS